VAHLEEEERCRRLDVERPSRVDKTAVIAMEEAERQRRMLASTSVSVASSATASVSASATALASASASASATASANAALAPWITVDSLAVGYASILARHLGRTPSLQRIWTFYEWYQKCPLQPHLTAVKDRISEQSVVQTVRLLQAQEAVLDQMSESLLHTHVDHLTVPFFQKCTSTLDDLQIQTAATCIFPLHPHARHLLAWINTPSHLKLAQSTLFRIYERKLHWFDVMTTAHTCVQEGLPLPAEFKTVWQEMSRLHVDWLRQDPPALSVEDLIQWPRDFLKACRCKVYHPLVFGGRATDLKGQVHPVLLVHHPTDAALWADAQALKKYRPKK